MPDDDGAGRPVSFVEWIKLHKINRALPSALKNVFTFVSPGIAEICFQHFQCVGIDGVQWVKTDLRQQCYTVNWWAWSAPAVAGIFMVAVPPLYMLTVLRRASK